MRLHGLLLLPLVALLETHASTPWHEILALKPLQNQNKSDQVIWVDDLTKAQAEARRTNRPLFVTLRCLPCKQCADFDREVLEGGPELDPLLRQFVTVRLTDAAQIDLHLLPAEGFQDLDLSWWGYFLSPDADLYGVFGGKDHVSDKTRISLPALTNTLSRILQFHYDSRRPSWKLNLKTETKGPKKPAELAGYKSWKSKLPQSEQSASCLHCHFVADILRQPAIDAKIFDKKNDIHVWPLPENVGLELDRDHGLLVRRVMENSPASKIGIQPGDTLGAAGGRPLFSQADFRGVLHRAPKTGTLDLVWKSKDSVRQGMLRLEEGWRATPLGWRMSVSQGNIGAPPGFFPLKVSDEVRKNRGIPLSAMAVEPFMGKNVTNPAYLAGVRQSDVVVSVNGQAPNLVGRDFLVWFRQQFEAGQKVTIGVVNPSGVKREITYVLSHTE